MFIYMLTVKTVKEDFPKSKRRRKKVKVLICAGGGLFRLYYYIFNESFRF